MNRDRAIAIEGCFGMAITSVAIGMLAGSGYGVLAFGVMLLVDAIAGTAKGG